MSLQKTKDPKAIYLCLGFPPWKRAYIKCFLDAEGAVIVGVADIRGTVSCADGLDVAKLLASALSLKDDVMTRFLRETELYDQDQYIADQIRAPLEDALRRAWAEGREPIVLAHSMGSGGS